MTLVALSFGSATHSLAATDPVALINALRARECGRNALPALSTSKSLQQFARLRAQGNSHQDAERSSGYLLKQSTLIQISGAGETELRQMLRGNYCSTIADPAWQQVAVIQQQQDWWIVLATPHDLPDASTTTQVLSLVNQARAAARRCGTQRFAATTPLQLNAQLTAAAQKHANDMATHSFMAHRGSDGSTPVERINKQGYRWKSVGENVAAGQGTADEVVTGWLNSPGHCANIMNPTFTEMGIAFAINRQDELAVYWAQSFGTPRK